MLGRVIPSSPNQFGGKEEVAFSFEQGLGHEPDTVTLPVRHRPRVCLVIRRVLAFLPLLGTSILLAWNLVTVPIEFEASSEFFAGLVAFLSALTFSLVGTYLALRLPHNLVGWVMAAYGFLFTFGVSTEGAATAGVLSPGWAQWVAWVDSWLWALTGGFVTVLLPLLFPDGKLPSRRWSWVPPTMAMAFILLFVANAFNPISTGPISNPLGQPGWEKSLDAVGLVGVILFIACIVAGAAAVITRFRRSRGIVRRQMTVFTFSAIALVVGTGVTFTTYELGMVTLANLVLATVSLSVPLAIGMAVLRYRLYEFGRIFKRTVTYSIVAAVLLGVYALAVVGLQALLGSEDSLSVAGSTLAAAALFNPVRRQVQAFVESHFDRARYDASLVVDEFSTRMLQEVDLDRLNADLVGVVDRTLRPAGLSLWLKAS